MGKQPSRRKQLRISKRLLLVVLTLAFSMASVGIMEDFQGNFWLKTYLLLGALFWGNLLIYLSFYPRWGQKLLQREQKKSGPISGPKSRHGQKN
ncbi:SID1 transmembrane family member [Synechocystis sp. B12]|uniref:SID1 transmembrane family member n=1 Tax=unclassified Synechocystis TaxID=2640012 RepID=UPI00040B9A8F|nr:MULTISPECIES: SID1 transmembrane family member [unclassified Synechocystis]UOO13375.1 SID1 transmembrane family member [Synechocystis sp. PCC 6803]WLT38955.1 SID1 transmembrane family member [Synechocystis sp. B12]